MVQGILAAMSLSVYPSPCKVTISALRTSVKYDFYFGPIAWMQIDGNPPK